MLVTVRKKISSKEMSEYLSKITSNFDKTNIHTVHVSLANGRLPLKFCSTSLKLVEYIRKEFNFVISKNIILTKYTLFTDSIDFSMIEKPANHKDCGKLELKCEGIGEISIDYENNVVAAHDYLKKESYLSSIDLSNDRFILKQGHLFVHLINYWARRENLYLLHCAAISVKGNGVLICGKGGRGKSTLAIASLLSGFDYISDDYLLCHSVSNTELEVYPIYSIITLSHEMHCKMNNLNAQFIGISPWTGKGVYSISGYSSSVLKGLRVSKVIFPTICHAQNPIIRPCSPSQPTSQIVTSTASQLYGGLQPEIIAPMLNLLKDLEYYSFKLTDDIFINAKYLMDFLNND